MELKKTDTAEQALDLGTTLPLGFCDECLQRMAAGALYEALESPTGERLVSAYCAHRETGATIYLRKGRPLRWAMTTPIDAVEWRAVVAARAELLGRFNDATRGNSDASVATFPQAINA